MMEKMKFCPKKMGNLRIGDIYCDKADCEWWVKPEFSGYSKGRCAIWLMAVDKEMHK